jgi:hypothetical protein
MAFSCFFFYHPKTEKSAKSLISQKKAPSALILRTFGLPLHLVCITIAHSKEILIYGIKQLYKETA